MSVSLSSPHQTLNPVICSPLNEAWSRTTSCGEELETGAMSVLPSHVIRSSCHEINVWICCSRHHQVWKTGSTAHTRIRVMRVGVTNHTPLATQRRHMTHTRTTCGLLPQRLYATLYRIIIYKMSAKVCTPQDKIKKTNKTQRADFFFNRPYSVLYGFLAQLRAMIFQNENCV